SKAVKFKCPLFDCQDKRMGISFLPIKTIEENEKPFLCPICLFVYSKVKKLVPPQLNKMKVSHIASLGELYSILNNIFFSSFPARFLVNQTEITEIPTGYKAKESKFSEPGILSCKFSLCNWKEGQERHNPHPSSCSGA
ncbi:hypothetical protein TorRG33x02_229920, partial [Trema orientale]